MRYDAPPSPGEGKRVERTDLPGPQPEFRHGDRERILAGEATQGLEVSMRGAESDIFVVFI